MTVALKVTVTLGLPLQRAILHSMRSQILAEFIHHHLFVIRPIAYIHLRNGLAFEGDDVGADAVKEPAAVGDEYGLTPKSQPWKSPARLLPCY